MSEYNPPDQDLIDLPGELFTEEEIDEALEELRKMFEEIHESRDNDQRLVAWYYYPSSILDWHQSRTDPGKISITRVS